jgi:hypothetical protein
MTQSPLSNVEIDGHAAWPAVLSSVRDYWTKKCGARLMPGRDDVRPSEIKKLLPHILLADAIDGGTDFRYRLVGTQIAPFFPANPSGQLMSDALAPFGDATTQATITSYRGVLARRVPMRLTGAGSIYGQEPKHFDAYLAPLSSDGETANMILGAFVFVWDAQHPFRAPLSGSSSIRPAP